MMKHELIFGGMVGGAVGLFAVASGAPAPLAVATVAATATATGLFINRMLHLDEYRAAASCTPLRYDPLTSQGEAQPERRPLPPPMRRPQTMAQPRRPYTADSCTPSRYNSLTSNLWEDDIDEDGVPESELLDLLTGQTEQPAVEPELQPIAVPDWPMPATVEDVPAPVVVNRTAARFASLEL